METTNYGKLNSDGNGNVAHTLTATPENKAYMAWVNAKDCLEAELRARTNNISRAKRHVAECKRALDAIKDAK